MLTRQGFTLDQTRHAVRFDRTIRATPEWLFQAWVDPAQLRLWWDPTGQPLTRCEVDLRLGGTLTLATADHTAHPFVGSYTLIEPPHRLEFDAMGARGSVVLTAEGDETRMVVEIRCTSAEHLAQFVQMGVAEGTAITADNLVAFANRQFAA